MRVDRNQMFGCSFKGLDANPKVTMQLQTIQYNQNNALEDETKYQRLSLTVKKEG